MLVKTCTKCNSTKELYSFAPFKAGKYGVVSECRDCASKRSRDHYRSNTLMYRLKGIKYYELRTNATPSWADKEAIAGMYQLAAIFNSTGINLHVDHIVPLKRSKVCGLHTEDNLRLLPATENITKGNRYWDDMWTTA